GQPLFFIWEAVAAEGHEYQPHTGGGACVRRELFRPSFPRVETTASRGDGRGRPKHGGAYEAARDGRCSSSPCSLIADTLQRRLVHVAHGSRSGRCTGYRRLQIRVVVPHQNVQ